jgi:hypothetical protein
MINAYGKVSGMRISRTKPAAVLLCPPQISHDLIANSGCGASGLSSDRPHNTALNKTTTSHVNEHFETYPRKNEDKKYISSQHSHDKYLIHSR